MAIYNALQNWHPLTDHQKISHRWLSRGLLCTIPVPNVAQIRPRGASVEIDEIYQKPYFFLPFFFRQLIYRSDRRQIFAFDCSNDVKSRLPFWRSPWHLGVNPFKPHVWSVNRHFQAKPKKNKFAIISKPQILFPRKKHNQQIWVAKQSSWMIQHFHASLWQAGSTSTTPFLKNG